MTILQKPSLCVHSRVVVPFVCGSGVVEIEGRDYHCDTLPDAWDYGRGFMLTALPFDRHGEDEVYQCHFANSQDFGCSCEEWRETGDCEHVRGMLELLAKGEV